MKSRFLGLLACGFLAVSTSTCDRIGLSEAEVAEGLREALKVGTDTAVTHGSESDGYFLNQAIKILLPPEASTLQTIVSALPGGQILLDNLILKLNRAAEAAAPHAKDIFVDAILAITIDDAFAILEGADDAATQYLSGKTFTSLYGLFKPDIESALSSVGAQQAWTEVVDLYNTVPFVDPVNADLADHTTTKALDGLFHLVADEEGKIRNDASHRVNEILQKVFGD
jgi:hypothetical protein